MRPSRSARRADGPPAPAANERWHCDAGAADVARLRIPPDAQRERSFELSCRFVVGLPAPAPAAAWHALHVFVDGSLEWSRRIPTSNPGHTDSLDVQFRRRVPVGRGLDIVARTEVGGARRVRLLIEADEG